MRAVIIKGKQEVAVENVDDPKILVDTDAIIKVTSAAICGSDLHMYDWRTSVGPGTVLGHEIMGVVQEAGKGVFLLKPGDRVSLPFNIACGFCFNCERGYPNACLVMNPESAGAGYGYSGLGPFRGGQAQYVRVPMADYNCLKLPGRPGDEWEDDFIMLSDIFPTGYHGAVLAGVKTGSTAAVFGAGPVGYMAALSCTLLGASQVFVVDHAPERLKKVEELGCIPVNFEEADPVEQIMEMRANDPGIAGSLRPGEDKMSGVMCGIDAVGYQALDRLDPTKENPMQVINDLVRVVNPTGAIGMVGAYFAGDPGAASPEEMKGDYNFPLGRLWMKGIRVGTGQTPVKRYNAFLRDLIVAGKARPGRVVSHRLPLDMAPDAYAMFDLRGEGRGKSYTKVVLKPAMTKEEARAAA